MDCEPINPIPVVLIVVAILGVSIYSKLTTYSPVVTPTPSAQVISE